MKSFSYLYAMDIPIVSDCGQKSLEGNGKKEWGKGAALSGSVV